MLVQNWPVSCRLWKRGRRLKAQSSKLKAESSKPKNSSLYKIKIAINRQALSFRLSAFGFFNNHPPELAKTNHEGGKNQTKWQT